MTEDEDDDVDGFQRLSRLRQSVHPADVSAWFSGEAAETAPATALKALAKLDAMSAGWRREEELHAIIKTESHRLTRFFLALDRPDLTDRERVREAVLRAYESSWRYANFYCDWLDLVDRAERTAQGIDAFLEQMDGDLWNVADEIDASTRYYPEDKSATSFEVDFGSLTRRMEEYAETLKIWSDGQRELERALKRREPRSFLILRLCEVYAILSGAEFSFHISLKNEASHASPDRLLFDFLVAAQEAVCFPLGHGGLDGILRGLDRQHPQVGRLGSSYARSARLDRLRGFDYRQLPSVGIQIDFNAFDDDVL